MSLFWWIYGGVLATVWIWGAVESRVGMRKVADLSKPEWDRIPGPACTVTVVVPAKDEAENIEQCLSSLLALEYPDFEIIAVDDRSRDETGAIMDRLAEESFGKLKVIHITEIPSGWLGKTHAMWRAAEASSGKWILFTDGDVFFRADSVRRAVAYAESKAIQHLVLFPTTILKSVGERMMLAFLQSMFVLVSRPWKVEDPAAKDHLGVGAFNLILRDAYQQIGTYRALRMEVIDDLKLGKAIKDHGLTQHGVIGPGLVSLWWARGAMGIVNNLTKNFFSLMGFRWYLGLATALVAAFFHLGIPLGIIFAPGMAKTGFVIGYAAIAAMYVGMSRYSNISPLYFLLQPVAAALCIYAMLRSMVVTLWQGGIVWRGTKYSLKELRP